MLLTKASEYALLSLVIIAKKDQPVDVDTLSKRLDISKSFLAKVLQNLAREGILKSYKGANGGFMLSSPAQSIEMSTIIKAAEKKPVSVFDCASNADCCPNDRAHYCSVWPFLNTLQQHIDTFLKGKYLSDIL